MSFFHTMPFWGFKGYESDSLPQSKEYVCDGLVGLLINTNDFRTALQKKKRDLWFSKLTFQPIKVENQPPTYSDCIINFL